MGKLYVGDILQYYGFIGFKNRNDMVSYSNGDVCFCGTGKVKKIIFKPTLFKTKAKELTTGVTFDLVYTNPQNNKFYTPREEIDTFVYLNSSNVVDKEDIDSYLEEHVNINTFKEELLEIKATGKENKEDIKIVKKIRRVLKKALDDGLL